ncbi:IMP dehydrogenase [Candidatus Roizmanbacteria bacterium]|nr:IMP dehydrogenase [Candidatus Roizmanbacteria bacterium]
MERSPHTPTFVTKGIEFIRDSRTALLPETFSYNDIVLLPGKSVVTSPNQVDTTSKLTRGIRCYKPAISANMNTVTEAKMAIFMAEEGAIGALHRALSIEDQVAMVTYVKGHAGYVIEQPPVISPEDTVATARRKMEEHERGIVMVRTDGHIVGLITKRDVLELIPADTPVSGEGIMTPRSDFITAPPDISQEKALNLMYENRIEKLVLTDSEGNFGGVITMRDIRELRKHPNATKDRKGRLQVLASIGVGEDVVERAKALTEAEVDGIIIDILHGDCPQAYKVIEQIARIPNLPPIIVGNVATPESTRDLLVAGADVVKVGYSDGSLCTTRLVTGTGRGQFRAVIECAAMASFYGKKVIADGSIQQGGDWAKAAAAGGEFIMVGGKLIPTDMSPGVPYYDEKQGRHVKEAYGMASERASQELAKAGNKTIKRRTPQGVQTLVPYLGPGSTEKVLFDLHNGLQSGIANVGGHDIESFQEIVRFERQTPAAQHEGRPYILYNNQQ